MSERFFESYLSQIREQEAAKEEARITEERQRLIKTAEGIKQEAGELNVEEKIGREFLFLEKETLNPINIKLKIKEIDPRFKKILDKVTTLCALSIFAIGLSQGLFAKEARAEERLIPEQKIELQQKVEGKALYEKLNQEFKQSVDEDRGVSEYVPYSQNKEVKKWYADQMLKIIREKGAVPAKVEYLGGQQIQFYYNEEGGIVNFLTSRNWRGSAVGIFKENLDLFDILREKYNEKLDQGEPLEDLGSPDMNYEKIKSLAEEINASKAVIADLEKQGRSQEILFVRGFIEEHLQRIIELAGEGVLEEKILEEMR